MERSTYKENLAKLGDWLIVEPFDSRKSEIRLTRTKLEIFLQKGGSFQKSGCSLCLRGMGDSARFEMNLIEEGGDNYFEIKALGNIPFLHNGTPTFHSRLRRNDRIDMDFNRFIIRSEKQKKDSLHLPIESWPREMFINLEGETGTGKSTLAKKFHDKFVGENYPFVQVNLSAFSENLLESELFGHEKGAFTGATRDRRGAIERASKGTLFIDELDSLPLHLQVKLLTFLDNGSYQKVGGERNNQSSCRIIFASGRPLKRLVETNMLRKDLYFRLSSGFNFRLSPLRKKTKLIEDIMNSFEVENGVTLSRDLRNLYLKLVWPGNIRQFKSHLMRKMYEDPSVSYLRMTNSDLELQDIDLCIRFEQEEVIPLREMKIKYCKSVLLKSQGATEEAARKLGIAPSTLRRMAA